MQGSPFPIPRKKTNRPPELDVEPGGHGRRFARGEEVIERTSSRPRRANRRPFHRITPTPRIEPRSDDTQGGHDLWRRSRPPFPCTKIIPRFSGSLAGVLFLRPSPCHVVSGKRRDERGAIGGRRTFVSHVLEKLPGGRVSGRVLEHEKHLT